MTKVKITANWCDDNETYNRTLRSCFPVEGIQLTEGNGYDFLVVLNNPSRIKGDVKVPKKQILGMAQEPSWSGNFHQSLYDFCGTVFVHDIEAFGQKENSKEVPMSMYFHMDWRKHTIQELVHAPVKHTKLCSMVVSNTPNGGYNYGLRTALAQEIKNRRLPIDVFGNGWEHSLNDKFDGLNGYRYSIAVENCCEKYMVSEKFFDPFLCGAKPIYYGAPCINELYSSNMYELVDLQASIDEQIERVMSIIEKGYNVRDVIGARHHFANEHNILKRIKEYIETC